MQKFLVTTVACVISILLLGASQAEEWKEYRFGKHIRISCQHKLTEQVTEKGKVYIAIEMSRLPNPKFSVFSVAIVPLTKEEQTQPEREVLTAATEFALDNRYNAELEIITNESQVWRGIDSMSISATSRFLPLPYQQYHFVRSFIHDGVRYSLSSSQLIECSNRIAISEFGLVPSDAEIRRERVRIGQSAEKFFSSFYCDDVPKIADNRTTDQGPK